MIAARTTTHAAAPAPRRSVLDVLLLGGIEYTNANPWFGVAGLAVTIVLGAALEGLLP